MNHVFNNKKEKEKSSTLGIVGQGLYIATACTAALYIGRALGNYITSDNNNNNNRGYDDNDNDREGGIGRDNIQEMLLRNYNGGGGGGGDGSISRSSSSSSSSSSYQNHSILKKFKEFLAVRGAGENTNLEVLHRLIDEFIETETSYGTRDNWPPPGGFARFSH